MTRLALQRRTRPFAMPSPGRVLQRKCAACGSGKAAEATCGPCDEEARSLQRQASSPGAGRAHEAPPIVHEVLNSPGAPLPPSARAFFEPRFSHDFSDVRVHTGAKAAESARAVAADAYTVGRDIVFAAGRHDGGAGNSLLAHELAHVVQQAGLTIPPGSPLPISSPGDAAEREADAHAQTAMHGGPPPSRRHPAAALLRQAAGPAQAGPQQQQPAAPARPVKGEPPCAADAYKVEKVEVDVAPLFFRSSATDAAPTGTSFANRLTTANEIWGKIGVSFKARSPVTVTSATHKTMGKNNQECIDLYNIYKQEGVRTLLVDHPMETGGLTVGRGTSSPVVIISDGGTSSTLLAHELGHAIGLAHPDQNLSDPGTIMVGSGSNSAENPRKNTIGNYVRITWPKAGVLTCVKPDE